VLIQQGQVLVERFRRVPFRRVAALGDPAEQVLLAAVKLDMLPREIALAASRDGLQGEDEEMLDLEPCELPALIEIAVGDAIDEVGGNPNHVDLRVSSLPNGWVRISIEDTGEGRPEELDFFRLFETTKREIGGLGLIVAGEIVTEHGGRLLARPMMCRGLGPSAVASTGTEIVVASDAIKGLRSMTAPNRSFVLCPGLEHRSVARV
jgi:Histidine kinase-, DNA gyrase B-, and HSP90-like ATPase